MKLEQQDLEAICEFNKKNKKFNPAQPFVAKASAKISKEETKEKPVKNFKKKLPWTKK